jgi:hypothetical protein
VSKVIGRTVHREREAWRVASGGQTITIVTSDTSARAMDEAIVIFDGALKRLADR